MVYNEAESGMRALELLRRAAAQGAAYDLAVLDLMMPGMDGFELARAIKADPDIAGVRLVLLTSFGQRGHGETARAAGIAAYLTKPVRQSHLFDALTTVWAARNRPPGDVVTADTLAGSRPVAARAEAATERFTGTRVLLAEDNPMNQALALRLLGRRGHSVAVANNGREALDALAREPFDLVIMDVQMPGMDGLETTRRLRRQHPAGGPPRVVALTAHAMAGDRERCLAAGMDGYLSKPVQLADLAAALDGGAGEVPGERPEGEPPDPLDRQSLDRLRSLSAGDGDGFLGKVIHTFLASSADDLAAVRRLAAEGRWLEVGRAAHRLKGSSATLGATRVAAVCATLEKQASAGRGQEIDPLIGRLGEELERACAALDQLMREGGG